MSADELLKALIWKRFGELYEGLPHSKEYHLAFCESAEVADLSHRQTFSCCESCPYVAFTAMIWCEHITGIEWEWGEAGTLPSILKEMGELEEMIA